MASEDPKIGNGLENDIQEIGWENEPMRIGLVNTKNNIKEDSLFDYTSDNPIVNSIINTSYSSALSLTY